MLFSELCTKEVVRADTGERIGTVDDAEIGEDFRIRKLVVYGRNEFLCFGARSDDIVVECADVDIVGEDIILVKKTSETLLRGRKRRTPAL